MSKLKGIFTALITPFNEDESINYASLEALIEKNIADGVDGFYVGGSTGEAFLLSMEERKKILEVAAKTINGRRGLISHVGAISTEDAAELARYAAEVGVDAVSAISPFYYKFSFDEIKAHYDYICSKCGLPMIVYNFPALSGVTLTTENIQQLTENPLIAGVKHTSMDMFQLERMKTANPELTIFNGYDEAFLAGLSVGADGAVGTTYNFMGNRFVNIHKAFLENDIEKAQKLQREANEIIEALCKVGVFQGTKYIISKQGISCGACRKPFHKLTDEHKAILDALFDKKLV